MINIAARGYLVETEDDLGSQKVFTPELRPIGGFSHPRAAVDPKVKARINRHKNQPGNDPSMPTFVQYDNLLVNNSAFPHVPQVNLGHMLLARTLKDQDEVRNARNVVDFFSGRGFLGAHMARYLEKEILGSRVSFIDKDPDAIACAIRTYHLSRNDLHHKRPLSLSGNDNEGYTTSNGLQLIRFLPGKASERLHGLEAQVMVTAPTPVYDLRIDFDEPVYLAKEHGAILYIAHPGILTDTVHQAAKIYGMKLETVATQEVAVDLSGKDDAQIASLMSYGLKIVGNPNHPIYKDHLTVSRITRN